MNTQEQEVHITELETRVDRLRVLYEQYFLGFEKLEPTVPRKDVERRFAVLRKEQIRNTALRFRFNVVTQKYNTYTTYWIRICRQIEDGTYRRHLQRAKQRFQSIPPSAQTAAAKTEGAPEPTSRTSSTNELSFDFDELDFDASFEKAMVAEASPPGPASRVTSRRVLDDARALDVDVGKPIIETRGASAPTAQPHPAPPSAPQPRPAPPLPPRAGAPPAPSGPARVPPSPPAVPAIARKPAPAPPPVPGAPRSSPSVAPTAPRTAPAIAPAAGANRPRPMIRPQVPSMPRQSSPNLPPTEHAQKGSGPSAPSEGAPTGPKKT